MSTPATSGDALARISRRVSALRQDVLNARITLAQERDSMLTKEEVIAMLDVYAELGR